MDRLGKLQKCCESDKDLETGEMFCLTHQTKICAICRVPIDEEEKLCQNCELPYGTIYRRSN